MKKFVTAIVALVAVSAMATEFIPLSVPERATWNATHVFVVGESDLTDTNANTAQTLTFNVLAKQSVRFQAMVLETAFDTAATNVSSLAVTVGDGTDADLYLTSTELASDGTEVFLKYAPPVAGTITVTLQKATLVTNTNGQDVAAVTNATAAFTGSALGEKVYTAADTIDLAFTPDAAQALSAFTSGKVRFYFTISQDNP